MEFQSVEPNRKETSLIDLNAAADENLEERELLWQLQEESHGNINVNSASASPAHWVMH